VTNQPLSHRSTLTPKQTTAATEVTAAAAAAAATTKGENKGEISRLISTRALD